MKDYSLFFHYLIIKLAMTENINFNTREESDSNAELLTMKKNTSSENIYICAMNSETDSKTRKIRKSNLIILL